MKHTLTLIAFLLLTGLTFGQITISGTVTDKESGETLPAVNVFVKDNVTVGTATDFDGKFNLKLPQGNVTIVFKSVGYQEQEMPIGNSSSIINISLESANLRLDDVVISASKRSEKVLDAPASVTIISSDKIQNNASALTAADHLKKVPGVDIMSTGLVSSNVNVRGFNNIFSGAMLTMVDYRIARAPSLRVNAFQFLPTANSDIERIEVVRGPGSALYGPNAADGVMHIITKSPLDLEDKNTEAYVAMNYGIERQVIQPEFRFSHKVSDKFGYKISGNYMQGNDWEYYDPREPTPGVDTLVFGSVAGGKPFTIDSTIAPQVFDRDFEIQKFGVDGRIDYAPTEDVRISFLGGMAQSTNLELTGLGAGQARDWRYYNGQVQFTWKDLFVQYFVNSSNSGGTYLIPQSGNDVQLLIDKSKLHAITAQHSSKPAKGLRLTYGLDILLTRPITESTINGRFEEIDNINQYGTYLQAEYDISDHFKILGAGRVDYHDAIDEFQVSPRAALVYKPNTRHTIRGTYNRAFSTPSTLNLSLDLSNGLIPNGINVRGIGNANGYNYVYGDDGLPQFLSPYDQTWHSVNSLDNNHVFLDGMLNIIGAGLGAQAGLPDFLVQQLIQDLLSGVRGPNGLINGVSLVPVDYVKLNAEGLGLEASLFDLNGISDLGRIESSVTQTIELGYKGMLAKDKLFLTIDGYYTRIKDFVSPLINSTASVIFNPQELVGTLGMPGPGGLLYDNLQPYESLLAPLLDGNPDYVDPSGTIPSIPGTSWDELVVILIGANQQLTAGSVTPDDEFVNTDIILTYQNVGQVEVFGTDVGFTYLAMDDMAFTGSFSWVDKDSIKVEGASGGYIALNAPRYKFSLGYDQSLDLGGHGLGFGATFRWQAGFPANSAIYVGRVEAYNTLDARVSYSPKFSKNTRLIVDMTNLIGQEYRNFPGTPFIGRLTYIKLQHTF